MGLNKLDVWKIFPT